MKHVSAISPPALIQALRASLIWLFLFISRATSAMPRWLISRGWQLR